MTGFIGCEGCNCLLREEDGPLCAACLHERRSEAAKKAAETRAESAPVSEEQPKE